MLNVVDLLHKDRPVIRYKELAVGPLWIVELFEEAIEIDHTTNNRRWIGARITTALSPILSPKAFNLRPRHSQPLKVIENSPSLARKDLKKTITHRRSINRIQLSVRMRSNHGREDLLVMARVVLPASTCPFGMDTSNQFRTNFLRLRVLCV